MKEKLTKIINDRIDELDMQDEVFTTDDIVDALLKSDVLSEVAALKTENEELKRELKISDSACKVLDMNRDIYERRAEAAEKENTVLKHIVIEYARSIFNADDYPCDSGYDCPIKKECNDTIVDCVSQIVDYLYKQAEAELKEGK